MERYVNHPHGRHHPQLTLCHNALDDQHLVGFHATEHQGFANLVAEFFQQGTSHGNHVNPRSEEHTSELQSRPHLVCRLLLEKKKKKKTQNNLTMIKTFWRLV